MGGVWRLTRDRGSLKLGAGIGTKRAGQEVEHNQTGSTVQNVQLAIRDPLGTQGSTETEEFICLFAPSDNPGQSVKISGMKGPSHCLIQVTVRVSFPTEPPSQISQTVSDSQALVLHVPGYF